MIVAVCVDNQNGLTFFGKRQSRDKEVIKDFMADSKGKAVISRFSETIFEGVKVRIDDDFMKSARKGEYCFVEDTDITPYAKKIEKIIVYCWNRDYPASEYFTMPDGFVLESSADFKGNSHDKITKQIFVREAKKNA